MPAGRTLIPGLHDAHGHFLGLGAALQQIDLRGTPSFAAIVAKVREKAATARPGDWILGRSWDQNDWPDKAWPTADALDAAAPANPVYLTRVDGHAALASRSAMAAAGVDAATRDPDGGRLIRDDSGRPTGVLIDRAMALVARHIPRPSTAQLDEQALLADAECRRLGLTTIHDAGVSGADVEVYKRLIDAGRLQTRLYVMLRMAARRTASVLREGTARRLRPAPARRPRDQDWRGWRARLSRRRAARAVQPTSRQRRDC